MGGLVKQLRSEGNPWHRVMGEKFARESASVASGKRPVTDFVKSTPNTTEVRLERPVGGLPFSVDRVVIGDPLHHGKYGYPVSLYSGDNRVATVWQNMGGIVFGHTFDSSDHRHVMHVGNVRAVASLAIKLHGLLEKHAPKA